MTRRACKSCGAFLRIANDTDWCWPCRPHDVESAREGERSYNQPWEREEAVEAARRWTEWAGRAPRKVDWEKKAVQGEPVRPMPYSVYKLFPGGWGDFLAAAGMSSKSMPRKERSAVVLSVLPAHIRDVERAIGLTRNGTRSMLVWMRDQGLVYLDGRTWRAVEAQEEAA